MKVKHMARIKVIDENDGLDLVRFETTQVILLGLHYSDNKSITTSPEPVEYLNPSGLI